MKKAFTLIELLVVVLIIGILTSVALPQYRFAVAKSRVMGKMIEIDALTKAIDRYVLANGPQSTRTQKTELLNALDIQIYRQPSDFETLSCYNGSCSIRCGFIMPSAENSRWGDVVCHLNGIKMDTGINTALGMTRISLVKKFAKV